MLFYLYSISTMRKLLLVHIILLIFCLDISGQTIGDGSDGAFTSSGATDFVADLGGAYTSVSADIGAAATTISVHLMLTLVQMMLLL